MNITKAHLCKKIAGRPDLKGHGIKSCDIKIVLESYFDEILNYLSEGHRIEIRGFGSYIVKNRKARIGRNPRTGQKVDVPAFKAPLFKFSNDAQTIFDEKLSG